MALPGVWLEGNLRNYVTAGLGEVGLPLSTETPVVAEDVDQRGNLGKTNLSFDFQTKSFKRLSRNFKA